MGGGIKIKSRQRFLLQALAIHFDSSPFTMGIAIEGAGAFGIRFPLSRHILIKDLLCYCALGAYSMLCHYKQGSCHLFVWVHSKHLFQGPDLEGEGQRQFLSK